MAEPTSKSASSSNSALDRLILKSVRPKNILKVRFGEHLGSAKKFTPITGVGISGEFFSTASFLKYATSKNGLEWNRNGTIAIDYKSDEEHAIAKPSVLFEGGVYKMWYSHKSHNYENYQIGYAESNDGLNWNRKDPLVKFDRIYSGFDDEMQAYPEVISYNGSKYMFFNGNGYGISGLGLAKLEHEV